MSYVLDERGEFSSYYLRSSMYHVKGRSPEVYAPFWPHPPLDWITGSPRCQKGGVTFVYVCFSRLATTDFVIDMPRPHNYYVAVVKRSEGSSLNCVSFLQAFTSTYMNNN